MVEQSAGRNSRFVCGGADVASNRVGVTWMWTWMFIVCFGWILLEWLSLPCTGMSTSSAKKRGPMRPKRAGPEELVVLERPPPEPVG